MRPPYIYRWAGLLTIVGLLVGVTAVVLLDRGPSTTLAAGPVVELPVATAPAVVPLAPVRPAIAPTLLTTTGGGGKAVALTFDDGPDPATTPRILDLLAQHRVHAVFCMVGQAARAHPDLVRRVVAEGHRLCNHTITHDPGIGARTPDVMNRQLQASRDMLVQASGGADVDYFRAPEGKWSPALVRTSAQDGMRALGWTVDPLDWTTPGAAAIVTRVQQRMHPGAVVLLHDGGGPRAQSVAAVEQLLPWLADRGYSFVLPT
ncbi:polysaccharide deacetylase family protein [Actinomycetospora termitidis]|uniref:Polysaccharide deacetylase family protein n=1 Tax=Actinomycetospora termitidis TaxID=3053470 RepID=A0ABT7M7Z1_9PSEU|nr:polysaccharide deacetylase family protein [Actinomycetospora sp. Odt1-22]MDL5156785.1 polysaccharide deacetylase family protein [Actinomycetospora sp. Odt1-22]